MRLVLFIDCIVILTDHIIFMIYIIYLCATLHLLIRVILAKKSMTNELIIF